MVSTSKSHLVPVKKSWKVSQDTRHVVLGERPSANMSGVCRQLFGLSDKNNISEQLNNQKLKLIAENSSREWNFDFYKEVPLPGERFLWQRVRASDLPSFYSEHHIKKDTRPPHTVFHLQSMRHNQVEDSSDAESCCVSSREKENKVRDIYDKSGTSCKKTRLLQTSIKDYTKVQKKRSSRRLLLKQLKSRKVRRYLRNPSVSTQL